MEQTMQVMQDVQTELVIFCLAIGAHLLFFHKLSLNKVAKPKFLEGSLPASRRHQASQKAAAEPNSSVTALKLAIRESDIKSAMTHFEELHSLWQDGTAEQSPSNAPNVLMERLVKLAAQSGALRDLTQLLARLGLMASHGCFSKALDLVLAESAAQQDKSLFNEAERLARTSGVKFTAATYQALIKGTSLCGAPEDAKQFLKEAQSEGMADIGTYITYMKGLLKSQKPWGNSREVHRVMETMRMAGMQPSTIAFNGLLSTTAPSNADSVWSLFDEMKAFNVKPDQVTCSILLKSISPKSKPSHLDDVIASLEVLDGEMDEVLLGSVVEACLRVGRADLLTPFLKKLRTSNQLKVKGAHTYGSIIRAYGYVHDIRGAWATWCEMKKNHVTPISVTLGCMVEALVTSGDVEAGYELIQDMLQDEKTAPLVNAVIYGSIVKGFSHTKCFSRVWEVYGEMVAQKLQFSMVTFNTLIDACARSGELGRIPSLLKDIDAQGLKLGIVTYSAILKGYCQSNRLDEAFELLEGMRRTAKLEPDEIMYNSLLDGCARQGLYDRGMSVLEKMQQSGIRPSNFTLSVLVKMANRAKRLDQAFEICKDLSSKYGFRLNVHVFANLVQACINHHDLPRAMGVLERMLQERVRPDVRTYTLLLRAFIEARKPQDAAGLLRAALGISQPHPQVAKIAGAAQLQGGLPGDLVSEIVLGLMDRCCEDRLAASILVEIGRSSPTLKLDPKLRLRLAARMADL
jgi:pentatricopeptide repeat protein